MKTFVKSHIFNGLAARGPVQALPLVDAAELEVPLRFLGHPNGPIKNRLTDRERCP